LQDVVEVEAETGAWAISDAPAAKLFGVGVHGVAAHAQGVSDGRRVHQLGAWRHAAQKLSYTLGEGVHQQQLAWRERVGRERRLLAGRYGDFAVGHNATGALASGPLWPAAG
jgi:hypothetical protein